MELIEQISDIFENNCNYKTINKTSHVNLRNRDKGIHPKDIVLYRLLYTQNNSTKEGVVSDINYLNKTNHSRQAFDHKDNNMSFKFYQSLFTKISALFYNDNDNLSPSLIAVDGVCNNDHKRNIMTNLGIFNINKNIPVDISFYGSDNRNNEVNKFKEYLLSNISYFKHAVFVCDRLYFTYDLFDFFINHDLKFIVRVKGSGNNLDTNIPLKKNIKNYDIINNIRSKIRTVKCLKSYPKTVVISNSKMKLDTRKIMVKNDCQIVTNLTNCNKYPDTLLLEYYNQRWDIEVFFKLIKNNFKFQNLNETSEDNNKKLYYSQLIITLIMKAIEQYYWKDKEPSKKTSTEEGENIDSYEKINKSHTINNIFKRLIDKIVYGKINKNIIDNFCKNDIKTTKNSKGRNFPRTCITPFKKWYVKSYSESAKYKKIIDAIENDTIDNLNKNLKVLASKITIIYDE